MLDSHATYPEMEGNLCRGVIVEDAAGRSLYPASMVIDATGDATVAHRAGVPCVLGENFLSYVSHGFTYESAKAYAEDGNLRAFRKWKNALQKSKRFFRIRTFTISMELKPTNSTPNLKN